MRGVISFKVKETSLLGEGYGRGLVLWCLGRLWHDGKPYLD